MVPVTRGKIKLIKTKGHNDMGHYFPSEWTVVGSDWFYMELHSFMEKREYENFEINKEGFDRKEVEGLLERIKNGELEIKFEETFGNKLLAHVFQMQRLIKKSKNLLWQYNVVNKDLNTWQRQMSCIGGVHGKYGMPSIRVLTKYEQYIKIPVLEYFCKILNKFNRKNAQKEINEWNRKMKKFFKRKDK